MIPMDEFIRRKEEWLATAIANDSMIDDEGKEWYRSVDVSVASILWSVFKFHVEFLGTMHWKTKILVWVSTVFLSYDFKPVINWTRFWYYLQELFQASRRLHGQLYADLELRTKMKKAGML